MLDDPISALDHQTAESVVRNCLAGPLVRDRTLILVTHRTSLCEVYASQVVEISDHRARIVSRDVSYQDSTNGGRPEIPGYQAANQSHDESFNEDAIPDKFMEDEHRAHGGVQALVYWEYIKAGKLKWWLVLVLFLILFRLISVARSWFLKQWGEAYDEPRASASSLSSFFDKLPSPEADVQPWLVGFFLIAVAQSVMFLVSQAFMLVIVYCAGRRMFKDIMYRVAYSTFRFFDITPVGRLLNRMTSDISTIDGNISQQFQNVAWSSITWISSIVVIASVTPLFLIFSFVLTASFVLIFLRFLPTSQSLRRLEVGWL